MLAGLIAEDVVFVAPGWCDATRLSQRLIWSLDHHSLCGTIAWHFGSKAARNPCSGMVLEGSKKPKAPNKKQEESRNANLKPNHRTKLIAKITEQNTQSNRNPNHQKWNRKTTKKIPQTIKITPPPPKKKSRKTKKTNHSSNHLIKSLAP